MDVVGHGPSFSLCCVHVFIVHLYFLRSFRWSFVGNAHARLFFLTERVNVYSFEYIFSSSNFRGGQLVCLPVLICVHVCACVKCNRTPEILEEIYSAKGLCHCRKVRRLFWQTSYLICVLRGKTRVFGGNAHSPCTIPPFLSSDPGKAQGVHKN